MSESFQRFIFFSALKHFDVKVEWHENYVFYYFLNFEDSWLILIL